MTAAHVRRAAGLLFVTVWLAVTAAQAAVGVTSHVVRVDGHPLHVWQHAADRKPARAAVAVVLLLHGRTWSTLPDFHLQVPGESLSLMDTLARRGLNSYGLDQRGYGTTPRDNSGWLTPARAAADTAAVLRWLRTRHPQQPLYVLGWSYGALLAHLTLQGQSELADGVILYGYPLREGTTTPTNARTPARAPTTAAGARSDFITPGNISAAAIDAFVSQALAADPVRADWRGLDQWGALTPAALATPLLLLHGEHDPLARPDVHARLFAGAGHADRQWVVLPGGDHAAHLEDTHTRFVNAVVAFVDRVRQPAEPAPTPAPAP